MLVSQCLQYTPFAIKCYVIVNTKLIQRAELGVIVVCSL